MNFIGLHTYPRYNEYYHYENQTFVRGPEPTVWIGLPGDYDADGQVTWSYPAYYAHSRRPNLILGMAEYETGRYHGGTRELFPTDGWGSEIIGETPPAPGDLTASNAVFNRAGHLFNTAFTHAQRIGVKTALGTELPASASPGQEYTAPPFVQVISARTQVEPGEDLALTLLAPGVSTTPAVSVRPLGSTAPWTEVAASSVGRSVYEATLPAQTEDFEYKVEAGAATYPASAPQTVATVTVASQPGSSSTDPSPNPATPTPPTQEILTTGVPQVGATLTVDPGLILDANETTLFTYQWQRGGSPIAGATSPSYAPTSADLGSTDNGTFVADGNDQGVAGIELQGNLVGGAGGSSANLGDYERMLAFVQRGAAGSTPLPVSGAVSAALTETIASFGGTVPAPAGTPSFGRIVSFGDSLSDRGNNGIASDGDTTWVDALSGYLGLGRSIPSLMGGFNYAYGGAVTGFPNDDSEPPSTAAQVQAFFAEHGGFAPDDLVTLWIGGNDFLENPAAPLPADILKERYTTILQGLVDLGATTILWPYVPDYGLLPDFQEEAATAYAASVNAAIDEVRAAMLAQNENLRIVLFDFPALQAELEQDFAEYQLAEPPSTPTPDGADPSVLAARFLLSDGVHPTTTGHEIIAAEALRSLQSSLAASGTAVQLGIRTALDPLDSGLLQVFLEAQGHGRHLLQRSTDLQNWTTLTPVEIVHGAHTTHRTESETPVFYRLATP